MHLQAYMSRHSDEKVLIMDLKKRNDDDISNIFHQSCWPYLGTDDYMFTLYKPVTLHAKTYIIGEIYC